MMSASQVDYDRPRDERRAIQPLPNRTWRPKYEKRYESVPLVYPFGGGVDAPPYTTKASASGPDMDDTNPLLPLNVDFVTVDGRGWNVSNRALIGLAVLAMVAFLPLGIVALLFARM